MDKDLIQYLNFDNSWTRFCVQFEFNAYWPGLISVLCILLAIFIYLRVKASEKPKNKMERGPEDYRRLSNIVLILTAIGAFFIVIVLKTANNVNPTDKISNTLTSYVQGTNIKLQTDDSITKMDKTQRFTGFMDVDNKCVINITRPAYNKIVYHPVNNTGRGYLLMLHYLKQRHVGKINKPQISANAYNIKATYVRNHVTHYVDINTNWPYVVRDDVDESSEKTGDDAN